MIYKEWRDNIKQYFTGYKNAVAEIITVNVAVFAIKILLFIGLRYSHSSIALYNNIVNHLSLPASLLNLLYQPYSLITFMFMHSGFMHIAFNMIGLYMFGQIVREYIGNYRIWPLFILGSLAGAASYLAVYNAIPPLHTQAISTYALGASAGVMTLVMAAGTLVPDNKVYLPLLGGVPIKYIALFYFLSDMASLASGDNFGGHIAHIGGAIFGFVFIKQLQSGKDLSKGMSTLLSNPKLLFAGKTKKDNVVKMKVPPTVRKNHTPSPQIDPQERIDQILDKISAKGYNALSEEEKNFLDSFSKNRT